MSVHVVIQPATGYGAEVIEPSPGVRQLLAGGNEAGFTVQVPARIGGLTDAARFAQSLASAATEFAEWCEGQNRNRTAVAASWHDAWDGPSIRKSPDSK